MLLPPPCALFHGPCHAGLCCALCLCPTCLPIDGWCAQLNYDTRMFFAMAAHFTQQDYVAAQVGSCVRLW